MHQISNKLFGIFTQPPYNGISHVFGAILDVDNFGKIIDFTPIDYDGKTIRNWFYPTTKGYDASKGRFAKSDKAILIPITSRTSETIQEALAEVRNLIRDGRNPFYWAPHDEPWPNPRLERFGRTPFDFNGKPVSVSHEEKVAYQREGTRHPQVATNCMDFLQNIMENIGGIPLQAISDGTFTMPRNHQPADLRDFITQTAGNAGKPHRQRSAGRLIDAGSGRFLYIYDSIGGDICLIGGLNGLPKLENGVSVAKYLTEHSQPFYDPCCNGSTLCEAESTVKHATSIDRQSVSNALQETSIIRY
jgi:hypothetical protein